MAVAIDAFSSSGVEDPPNWTHTPVATPRGVVAFAIDPVTLTDEVTGIDYGTLSLTEIAGSPFSYDGGSHDSTIHVFFAGESIPTGAQTVAVDGSASVGFAYTFTGDTDLIVRAIDRIAVTETSGDKTATLDLGGVVCAVVEGWFTSLGNPGNVDPLTGWTSEGEVDFGAQSGGSYSYDTVDDANVTFGLSHGGGGFNDTHCVAIGVAEDGGGEDPEAAPKDRLHAIGSGFVGLGDSLHPIEDGF